jgi:hypothetical protein
LIDFELIENNSDELARQYANGKPFECVVIDGFLTAEGLEALETDKLIQTQSSKEFSSDFVFAKNKIENPLLENISPELAALKSELLSDRFRKILCKIVKKDVFLDDSFTGGGLHQGLNGSYLEMHTDFTRHPTNLEWVRELNLLLYLNKGWKPEYGGCLDLENDEDGEKISIEPLENRMVIMLTKPHTIHGYKAINFPNHTMRTSVAAYAYSIHDGIQSIPYASTKWYPKNPMKYLLSLLTNKIVPIKQKLFGSRTADRAKRK